MALPGQCAPHGREAAAREVLGVGDGALDELERGQRADVTGVVPALQRVQPVQGTVLERSRDRKRASGAERSHSCVPGRRAPGTQEGAQAERTSAIVTGRCSCSDSVHASAIQPASRASEIVHGEGRVPATTSVNAVSSAR